MSSTKSKGSQNNERRLRSQSGGEIQQKIRAGFTLVEGPAKSLFAVMSSAIAETTLAVIVLSEPGARYPVVPVAIGAKIFERD